MILSHSKVPEIRDGWLRDENEIVDIFLAKGVCICRCAVVDEHLVQGKDVDSKYSLILNCFPIYREILI